MKNITLTLLLFCLFCTAKGQSIAEYEYWFDYQSNERIETNSSNGNITLDLDVSNLSKSIHFFNFRAKDNHGNWSAPVTQYFYIPESIVADNKIVAYEYWYNHSDSVKTRVNITPVNPLELQNQLLEVNNLIPSATPDSFLFVPDVYGEAKIYYSNANAFIIRFLDESGKWSAPSVNLFGDGQGFDVVADTLYSDVPVTKTKPNADEIHFYKLDALTGDSLIWKTDQPCTIQVFDPFGVEVYKATGDNTLSFDGVRAKRDGVYYVLLHSVDSWASEITFDYKHIHKYDVLGYDVKKVGNQGVSTINFSGNGFESATKVVFENNNDIIIPDTIICKDLGNLSTIVDFKDRNVGVYDVKVIFTDTTIVIEKGLEVEEFKPIELDVSIVGPSSFRAGTPTTYTITVTNKGNVTAYQVPLNIKIIADTENAIQNLRLSDNIPKPQMPDDIDFSEFSKEARDSILMYYNDFKDIYHFLHLYDEEAGEYIHTNDFFITIPSNSTFTVTITLTSSTSIDIEAAVPNEWSVYQENNNSPNMRAGDLDGVCCVYNAIDCILTLIVDPIVGTIPGAGCIYAAIRQKINFPFSIACNDSQTLAGIISNAIISYYNSVISTAISCVPEARLTFRIIDLIVRGVKTTQDCVNTNKAFLSGDCFPPPKKDKQHFPSVSASDPNDKYGYRSPSGSTYFKGDVTNMTYVINFENDPEKATVAAQDVYITDTLDLSKFDINSFRAGYVLVGDKFKQTAYDVQEHSWDIDMRPEMNLITRVNLSLDKDKGIAQWHFASIDPVTDEPVTDVFAGFLPPDDETGRGQGSVSFTIDLNKEMPNDTEVSNRAEIIFDNNDPILTPDWSNRKDMLPPVSQMLQPVELDDNTIRLSWKGEDSGSGVWYYTVYARSGETGNWYTLSSNTEQTETQFQYEMNVKYGFYVEATDKAGNKEIKNPLAEVTFYNTTDSLSDNPDDNPKDIVPPMSHMLQPVELENNIIQLSWEGEDSDSGISYYTVYARSGDNGDWYVLINNTEQTETQFPYEFDIKYGFYVVATDKAGNKEIKDPQAEVTFYKSSPVTDIKDVLELSKTIYPNPTNGMLYIKGNIDSKINIYNLLGKLITTTYSNKVDMSNYAKGVYLFQIDNEFVKVIKE